MKIPIPICHLSNPPRMRAAAFLASYGGSAIIALAVIAAIVTLLKK